MNFTKFSDYYTDSLIKDPSKDYLFEKNDSDKWLSDHLALTKRGSLVIGIAEGVSNINYFLEIYIIPEIIEHVKKYKDREIIFLTNESENEKYVYDKIIKKFPDKKFSFKKMESDVIKEIRKIELENKNGIAVLNSENIFSRKNLIEYI